jgi:hypothetical protein
MGKDPGWFLGADVQLIASEGRITRATNWSPDPLDTEQSNTHLSGLEVDTALAGHSVLWPLRKYPYFEQKC